MAIIFNSIDEEDYEIYNTRKYDDVFKGLNIFNR